MRKAILKWLRTSEGGKKTIPNINEKYYPMLSIKGQNKVFDWSLVVVNQENIDITTTIAEVYFLMDNAPHDVLVKDLEFSLLEGNRLVANGIIQ